MLDLASDARDDAGSVAVLGDACQTRRTTPARLQVERPHGLPTAKRQRVVRRGRSAAYRDVYYRLHRLVVELDGRLGHEQTEDRWDDLDRDVDSAVDGDRTVRLGWRHVDQPCRTARAVVRLLRAQGWEGAPRRCGPGCVLDET